MKKIIWLVLLTGLNLSAHAQSPATNTHPKPLRIIKKPIATSGYYVSIAYELEMGSGPQNGISFQYLGSTNEKRKYYLGVKGSVSGETPDVSIYEYTLSALSLELSQRFMLGQNKRLLPFIDFDFGYRHVHNSAEVPIVYGAQSPGVLSSFGFRSYTGGESTDIRIMNGLSGHVGAGCFINIGRGNGFFVKLGYRFTNSNQLIDKNSLGKTSNNISAGHVIGYNTYASKPAFVTLGIGVTIGKLRV